MKLEGIQTFFRRVDRTFGTNTYEMAKSFYFKTKWIKSEVKYLKQLVKFKVGLSQPTNLKLHLGCGGEKFNGYIIDIRGTNATDIVCSNTRKLPFPNNSVERIESYHMIEHIPRHDVEDMLNEWYRVLKRGGSESSNSNFDFR